ncbi:DUF4752 family protein [Escherichia coli]|uniref:DUF4752 family protein n=3 Tax=Escherichia coli TaxID=562 RepID=UPI000541AF12|nr:DUF4752 family protein [Escherichia coli]EEV6991223.1 DUF4752 family protein [Escherichia coli]EFA5142184.1 DUF4752 family protein [Escherichia coli]EFA6994761.1 DUF4752 family protein [Escherichia coli]EFC3476322.1 DUF4752 family protein [Escherichia coli]EFC4782819.1 DUF4752 family protein [Escherichia coli]
MVIDKTITIDIAMNAGIALLGWCYIMLRAGMWLSLVFLKTWNKHRKQTQQQKAMNAFFEAFDIDSIEPGEPTRVIPVGDVVILVYRSEKNKQEAAQ